MSKTAFEIVVLFMRYFFVAIILYIIIRLIQKSISEYRLVHRIKLALAGYQCGSMLIREPAELAGSRIPLAQENLIGRDKRNDVIIDAVGVIKYHALLYEKNGRVFINALSKKAPIYVNGEARANAPAEINIDDKVKLGEFEFVFQYAPRDTLDEE